VDFPGGGTAQYGQFGRRDFDYHRPASPFHGDIAGCQVAQFFALGFLQTDGNLI
jgi:hypothetical protein